MDLGEEPVASCETTNEDDVLHDTPISLLAHDDRRTKAYGDGSMCLPSLLQDTIDNAFDGRFEKHGNLRPEPRSIESSQRR